MRLATPSGLRFFHGNPNKAAELGRRGGRKKRPIAIENADSLPSLDNAVAVRDTLARIIPAALAGKLDYKVAAGGGPLLNLQLRAIDMVNLQQSVDADGRMTNLEKQVAEIKHAAASEGRKCATPLNGRGAPQVGENLEPEVAVDSNRGQDEPQSETFKVQFKSGSTILGTATLSDGTAEFTTTFSAEGEYQLKATYEGSSNYLRSFGTTTQTVQ